MEQIKLFSDEKRVVVITALGLQSGNLAMVEEDAEKVVKFINDNCRYHIAKIQDE